MTYIVFERNLSVDIHICELIWLPVSVDYSSGNISKNRSKYPIFKQVLPANGHVCRKILSSSVTNQFNHICKLLHFPVHFLLDEKVVDMKYLIQEVSLT